ncbi:MAG: hypothetical protein GTN80_03010, partial [Nitrososphaeria archaeon]|nr:hypothetical protein [Nitrososphaeria archaeon]
TYGVFPWAFLVQAKFRLHEYGFSHSILVKTIKTGRLEPMPWGIAFHPYFYTPKGEARIRIG